MEKNMEIFRQGDILLVRVSKKPNGLRRAESTNGRFILARGEQTGHHHSVLAEEAELLLDKDGEMFLQAMSDAVALEHQEHATLTLPKGTYKVIRQRSYTPQAIIRVAD